MAALQPRAVRWIAAFPYVAILLAIVMAGIVAWALAETRAATRRQAEQSLDNMAIALSHDIEVAVTVLDFSLRSAIEGMKTPGLSTLAPSLRQAILFDAAVGSHGIGGVFIADATGHVIYDSQGPVSRVLEIGDRPYFQAHRDSTDQGLFISPPLKSRRDGAWDLALSRRIDNWDGSFAGVIVAGMRLSYFNALFNALKLTDGSIVAVFNTSGTLVTRRPFDESAIGRDLHQLQIFKPDQAASRIYESTSALDGTRRIFTYRRIADLPLILVAGKSVDEVFADWRTKSMVLGGVVAMLLALGLTLAWALRRELRRRARAEAEARSAAQDHITALARLDALFANSPDSMLVARAISEGDFVYEAVNPVWERLSGVSAAQAIGRSPRDCLAPALAEAVLRNWRDCVQTRQPLRFMLTSLFIQSGVWEASISPVVQADGHVSRIIAVARDITERNELETKLRDAQRAEAVGQLTAGVAHDFNNLLQAIQGALSLLHDHPGLDAEGRECATVAAEAAQRGAMLVHRLLAFASKQALAPAQLRPAEVLDEIAPLLRGTFGSAIMVRTEIGGADWSLQADRAQLQDCLLNLALNARDAMPAGGTLLLRASTMGADAALAMGLRAKDHVGLSVRDTGIGMSAEILARALDPYFTTKPLGKGTGLGLSMVQGFIRQSGGEVQIMSMPGEGTTVTLWLPRALGPRPESPALKPIPEAPSTPPLAPSTPPAQPFRGQGCVLVVDDEPTVRRMLVMVLEKAGYETVSAEHGDAALALLEQGIACDVLLTDQSMPGITGSELIRRVSHLRPGLPAILVTGYDMVSGLDQMEGEVSILRKPFPRQALLDRIGRLVGDAADPTADRIPAL